MSIKPVIQIVVLSIALCVTSLAYAAGGGSGKEAELLGTEKDATPITEEVNKDLLKNLPFSDREDFKNAQKGFIARGEEEIKDANGKIVWSTKKFAFMQTVNPSLWRQMLLVNLTGLFKVDEHIYQVRNYDLSNITFIEGKSGLIVMDPLTSAEKTCCGGHLLALPYRPFWGCTRHC